MRRLAHFLLAGMLLPALIAAPPPLKPTARPVAALAAGATYIVNSTHDKPDADLGDPACADVDGQCTLRAAIMQANFVSGPNTITVPAGVYLLTRPGDDDMAVVGDLDITDDLAIQGAGSRTTIVDGNGAVTGDRVFQITAGAKETSLSGLTIRNGRQISGTFSSGGGLTWQGGGGHLNLNDVVFEANSAHEAGGVSLTYTSAGGSVDMEHVTIRANTSTFAGGGLSADFTSESDVFLLRDSSVYSNTAFEGGGLALQGVPTFAGSLRIENTEIYSNTANGFSGGIDNYSGDAALPLVVSGGNIHDNQASSGGAISNFGSLVISQTTLAANTAALQGGALWNCEVCSLEMAQTTLSGNLARFGAGLYAEYNPMRNESIVTLTNSTISGNTATRNGAGLYANGGRIQIFNATIAGNHVVVPNGTADAGLGGGLYISPTAVLTANSTIIAGNTHHYGFFPTEPDDCYGTMHPYITNIIQTTTGCTFIGPTFGNILGQNPLLGPLQFNGGPTPTMALLLGSPALNAGPHPYCFDPTGAALTVDQRGFARPASPQCDIGAFEYYPPGPFLPLISR